MNKKEMEEKILELEEMIGELISIVRLVIDGFKQFDNTALVKELIKIAKGNFKGMSKNTDFLVEISKLLEKQNKELCLQEFAKAKKKKKERKIQSPQSKRGIYI